MDKTANVVQLSTEELETLLSRAANKGARQALADIGLEDEQAPHDIRDLRSLLAAVQAARKTIWQTIIRMLTTSLVIAFMTGVAIKLKIKIFGGS